MSQVWRVLLVLAALGLAGCSGGGGSDGDGNDDDIFDPVEDLDEGKGVVRGVVVDQAVRPVEGAQVTLLGVNLSKSTDANGAFTFSDLDPGEYFLKAEKLGYEGAQTSVSVMAGVERPPASRLLLTRVPGTEPFAQTLKFDGFLSCSAGEPLSMHDCGPNQGVGFFPSDRMPRWIQTEIVWESTQPAGDNLYVIQGMCDCTTGLPSFDERFNETGNALSVHVARATPGFLSSVPPEMTTLVVNVSASGPALGTGVALEQEFQVYATFLYNMDLQDDWLYTRDGDHPIPT